MAHKRIWQLPMVRNKNICPVCGEAVSEHKSYPIAITYPNHTMKFHECDVLYCANCDIPLADSNVGKRIFETSGAWICTFSPNKHCSVASVRSQIHYRKKKDATAVRPPERKFPFELVGNTYTIWKLSKTICELSPEVSSCPKCHIELVDDFTLIPVNNTMNAKIPGRLCPVCKTIYVSNAGKVSQVMRDNPLSKGFTLNGHDLWNATQREKEHRQKAKEQKLFIARKERLSEIPDAVMMICAKFRDQPVKECIITTCNRYLDRQNIFHYASAEGRELLSAAFAKERFGKGSLHDCNFSVMTTVFSNRYAREHFEQLLPIELKIQTGGGYYSSVMNKRYEIVDLLLYSPFSQRYEIIRATLDKEFEYCFSDIGLYRQFVHKYGNPGINLHFGSDHSNDSYDLNLRAESILKLYGYSVASADHLSAAERQSILSEIIDLGILEVSKIISYINFFCCSHPSDKDYFARLRWIEDRKFVENYKANPERFLIAQTKAKKDL